MAGRSQIEHLLQRCVAGGKAADVEQARELLSKVIHLDPGHQKAWLWMSGVVADEDKLTCLEKVLETHWGNEYARLGLQLLLGEPVKADQAAGVVSEEEVRLTEVSRPADSEEPPLAEGAQRATVRT